MGKSAKKDAKVNRSKKAAAKRAPLTDLSVKDATGVKGGRKAGSDQPEYLQVKLTDVIVTGWQ